MKTIQIISDYTSVIRYHCDINDFDMSVIKMECAMLYCDKRERPSMIFSESFDKWYTYQFNRNSSLFAEQLMNDAEMQSSSPDVIKDMFISYQQRETGRLYPNKKLQVVIDDEVFLK